jgi:hypothetical protein
MKPLTIALCAAAVSSLTLVQMTAPADARSRHKSGMMHKNSSKTGGMKASTSAAGGNSASPAQPGARGSGGASGSN